MTRFVYKRVDSQRVVTARIRLACALHESRNLLPLCTVIERNEEAGYRHFGQVAFGSKSIPLASAIPSVLPM
jgi:hypothetical protein